jgi:ABC-2 type transport system permease protein
MAYFLMLLFCGVNIPLDVLAGWMQAVGRCLPLTHGIAAAREVAAGASLGDVSGLVLTELGIGVAYAAAGLALFRILERESRRTAVLDAY